MAGNNGRGKILSQKETVELRVTTETGGRHAHTRGITMSRRKGKGKFAGKRLRSEAENSNADEGVPIASDPIASDQQPEEMCHEKTSASFHHTSALHHHTPTSESCWDSFDTDTYTDTSMGGPHVPQPDDDPTTIEPKSRQSFSSGSVHRKKDSRGRFVGSVASSSACVKKKKDDLWVLKQPMPGGPTDIGLLKSYGGHVAVDIWNGEPRGVLVGVNRASHCRKLASWRKNMSAEVVKLVDGTQGNGFSFIVDCLFDHLDMPLLSAFVERWQPDTNTFHLPFGEMTITLHDVYHILKIPIEGQLVECEAPTTPNMLAGVGGLVKKSAKQMCDEHVYQHGAILTSSIIDSCNPLNKRTPEVEALAFLMASLGTFG